MKYLRFFEKFNASVISKTIHYLKEKGINSYEFIEDVKKLLGGHPLHSHGVGIDKISDEDFKYLSGLKAVRLTSEKGIDCIHSIKYWFSLDSGYMGSSLTKLYNLDFPIGLTIKHKNEFGVILSNAGDNISISTTSGDKLVKKKDISYLENKDIETYRRVTKRREDRNLQYRLSRIRSEIRDGDQYRITRGNIGDILRSSGRYRGLINYSIDGYQIVEFEKLDNDWYILSNDSNISAQNEDNNILFRLYDDLSERGVSHFVDSGYDIIIIDNKRTDGNNIVSNIHDQKLSDDQKIKEGQIDDKSYDQIVRRFNSMDVKKPLVVINKIYPDKFIKVMLTERGMGGNMKIYNGYLYKYPDTNIAYMIHNDGESSPENQLLSDGIEYDKNKYGNHSFRITSSNGYSIARSRVKTIKVKSKMDNNAILSLSDIVDVDGVIINQGYKMKIDGVPEFTGNPGFDVKNADFALVLDIDVLGKYNIRDKRINRVQSRVGAERLISDDKIKSANFKRYAVEISKRMNIHNKDMENLRLTNIVNKILMGKLSIYNIIGGRFGEIDRISGLLIHMFNFIENGSSDEVESAVKDIESTVYRIYHDKTPYTKSTIVRNFKDNYINNTTNNNVLKSKKILMIDKFNEIGQVISDKVLSSDINSIVDLEIVSHNIKQISEATRKRVGSFYLPACPDFIYSINNYHPQDAFYYFERITEENTDICLKSLNNLEKWINKLQF